LNSPSLLGILRAGYDSPVDTGKHLGLTHKLNLAEVDGALELAPTFAMSPFRQNTTATNCVVLPIAAESPRRTEAGPSHLMNRGAILKRPGS